MTTSTLNGSPIIKVTGLSKSFGSNRVLKDIDAEVA